MSETNLSGALVDRQGNTLPETPYAIVPKTAIEGVGDNAAAGIIVSDVSAATTALITPVTLYQGYYYLRYNVNGEQVEALLTLSEDDMTLGEALGAGPLVIANTTQQAIDAAATAEQAALDAITEADRAETEADRAQAAADLADSAGNATAAQAARDEAEAFALAAASAGFQSFDTVADMIADTDLTAGQLCFTLGYSAAGDGGRAKYRVAASTTEAASFYETLSNGAVAVLEDSTVDPRQCGYNLDASAMTTPALTAANWAIMHAYISHVVASARYRMPKFDPITTPEAVFAEWISGRTAPIGFYSDSTTDGAETTLHTSSTGSDSPYAVTINESPNAYPAEMEAYVDKVTNLTTSVRCYNGGFDSQSFANGFGLNHWYNTWFRGLSGSNVDWSDVAMIVIAFGTTDSINLDDTGGVIDAYEADVEAVIIDCFLRGVQPALQGPVMTIQGGGTTLAYRDADESVTIIEAVQKRLADKYGLRWFSMAESVQKSVDNWDGYNWRGSVANDGVHPEDLGHRLHAGYLIKEFSRQVACLPVEKARLDLFVGSPHFVAGDHSDKLFPVPVGGLVLQQVQQANESNNSHIYEWLDSEGNGKTSGEELLRFAVWVEKPCALYQTCVENNRTVKPITLESMTLADTASDAGNAFDAHEQPETEYYSHKRRLCFLHYGLNIIYVYASDDGPDQKLGGFEVWDAKDLGEWTVSRGTGGTSYFTKTQPIAPSFATYTRKSGLRQRRSPADFYNASDDLFYYMDFELAGDLASGTTYSIYTHYNDLGDFQEGYNLIEILDDVVTLKRTDSTGTTTVATITKAGLLSRMVSGANVTLRFSSEHASGNSLRVSLLVNGAVEVNVTAAAGEMWTDGYGFDAPNTLFRNATIQTIATIPAALDLDRLF